MTMRYDYAQEWVDIVKQAWTRDDTFDFDGKFLQLKRRAPFPSPTAGRGR